MIKSRRISDLLNPAPKINVKDYSKVNYIFKLYYEQKYDSMAREIFFYKDFWFFRDALAWLTNNFTKETTVKFFYEDIVDAYLDRLCAIWTELDDRTLRKKYYNG